MNRDAHTDVQLSARDQAALVQLADGAPAGRRRARAEARLSRIPNAGELLERQRRVAVALRSAGPAAPPSFAAGRFAVAAAGRRTRLLVRAALVAAPVAVAAALSVVLVLPGGDATVAAAADLAALPAEQGAPPARNGLPLLATELEGIPFPDWSRQFGWHAVGARDDRLEGRETKTVYYQHEGHLIGYTIVAGEPLPMPDGADHVRARGRDVALLRDGDRDIAVFVRGGHTCVLAGHVLERATLVKLATWEGGGAIRF